MSELTHDQPGAAPDESKICVRRYMSFGRFVWMLQNHALWMARVDTLQDKWEMTLDGPQLEHVLETAPVGLAPGFRDRRDTVKRAHDAWKRIAFVNCWSGCPDESHALWKVYCHSSEGVLIQTTLERLRQSAAPDATVHWVTY